VPSLFIAFSTFQSQHTGADNNTEDLRCLYMFIYPYGKQLTKKNNKENERRDKGMSTTETFFPLHTYQRKKTSHPAGP
jgi:hypothetical protein